MFPMRTILHPTDFSDSANCALQLACSLARQHNAQVVILHVVPLPAVMYGPPPENYLDHLLDKLCHMKPSEPEARVQHLVVEGDAATEILRVAGQVRCDLIVMGTHGRRGLGRLLLGSVAERVVRQASCPVMTVKAPQLPAPCAATSRGA
jgi:nucleotide-binding universal stress UspA family protein